jgi:hypothetical protein
MIELRRPFAYKLFLFQDDCLAINRGTNITFADNYCQSGHGISIVSCSIKFANLFKYLSSRAPSRQIPLSPMSRFPETMLLAGDYRTRAN